MKTVRRFIYAQVLQATAFVAAGFILLFLFFDLIDQLDDVRSYGSQGYSLARALLYVTLEIPSRLYELLPIVLLIGTIYVMAKLAASSEFTILRTSGLEPMRALGLVLGLGAAFAAFTFVLGDYVAPATSQYAQTLQARYTGDITVGRTGAWLRDRQGSRSFSVNVGAMTPDGTLNKVRIFAFDSSDGRPLFIAAAATARFDADGWALGTVSRRSFKDVDASDPHIQVEHLPEWHWSTNLTAETVAAALLNPKRMRAPDLYRYIRHLRANGQNAQSYEIEFWRKIFYPLGCLVMVLLALPFAYLHARSPNLAGRVFVGVLVGVSFFLFNSVLGFVGNLRSWLPWLTAAIPGLLYALLGTALFARLALARR